jgi:lipoic acid synthetase
VIRAVRERTPECDVEVLTPDFRGVDGAVETILPAGPVVFSHNIETVPSLYRTVRVGSTYERSISLLQEAIRWRGSAERPLIKTGLMLGLGEEREELISTLQHLAGIGVDILTLGQYLRPTMKHLPVVRYCHPDEFAAIRQEALTMGYRHVEAGPLVRSSYHARKHTDGAIANS